MKEQIRKIIISYGADLCGFADISRFTGTPPGYSPCDIYPGCKSAISFAVALPRGLSKAESRLIYGHFNYLSCHETDIITFKSAKEIEKNFNCTAIPVPCDNPYEYWDSERSEGRGLISMKHTAVQAGLGSLGKNTMLITRQYGNMVTLGVILTDLEIPPDTLSENLCIKNCQKCIEACPVNAIENGMVNQKACRANTYGKNARGFDTVDCNRCRTVCPLNIITN